ncbi:MAG: alpha/beta hydrolase [Pseudomonadota bacterium]
MKAAETDLLFVPGYTGSGPDHWQTRWANHFSNGSVLGDIDYDTPNRAAWTGALREAIFLATRPVVLIGHSMGVATIVHTARTLTDTKVRGAFLVGYADVTANDWIPGGEAEFAPIPRQPLQFPSILVASRNDPYCRYDIADELGGAWGSMVVDAGEAGHINSASGHGPWPEGSLLFGKFLSRLSSS